VPSLTLTNLKGLKNTIEIYIKSTFFEKTLTKLINYSDSEDNIMQFYLNLLPKQEEL